MEAVAVLPDEGVCLGLRVDAGPQAGEHRLMVTMRDAASRDHLQEQLAADARCAGYAIRPVEEEDRDWVAEVAATEVAVSLGTGFAALPGSARSMPGRRGIRLPRSRAFGTGEHPSTRMAAALLEEVAGPGRGLLDLGTGTGVLAVLGRYLGSEPVVAVDKDTVACAIAAGTFKENGAGEILLLAGTLAALRPACSFALIVANIERDVLLEAMPDLLSHLEAGGHLILSGLLTSQVDEVAAAAARWGGVELQRRSEEEWGALALTRRPGRSR
jgi:ribosomal protein L11 methyltransferase